MTEFEAASFSSSASSSSSTHPWKYDVFLSFKGEDKSYDFEGPRHDVKGTRYNFTGHLYRALDQKGIITFMDDQLIRGEEISAALLKAIELSKISIIVFSEGYAFSKWCMDELVKILDCQKSNQQKVLPVFYKVDPSDIRNHRGSFEKGLASLERKFKDDLEKIQIWKAAITGAAKLKGWTLSEKCSEAAVIQNIVKQIEEFVNSTILDEAKYPVGIKPRVKEIHKLLGVEGKDVHMVGIWGAGGIGKTTIAKAIFNSIAHKFEGRCFLENVRENSKGAGGFVKLQKKLLFEILRGKLEVGSEARGITMIKDRLRYKRVLLVLDDVNNLNQLNNLAGGLDWFGPGSRIIITTRDNRLLVAHDIYLMYSVKQLDYHEAVELFSWHAFKGKGPSEVYVELTKRAIGYAQGLPLALRVLGSHLHGGNLDTWKETLDGFKSTEIQEILRVSYDALVHSAKDVFLDIACFFNGEKREYVIEMLEGCGLNSKNSINVLIEMALININQYGRIVMHDLLEELGKDIVHQESPNDPGERSRLWFHDDVYSVLTENTGTAKITGIKVELPEKSDEICLSSTSFSNMRNLRLFIHRAGCFSGVLNYLPNSLRVVDWPDCPFQSLPPNFNARKLAVFKMPGSRITRLMEGYKNLTHLTSINLSYCQHLTKVSDLSKVPNLKELILIGCTNLREVHPSVGLLDKLTNLNLLGCSSLTIFPARVRWKSLTELNLNGCDRLENFVEIVDEMDCVSRLNLNETRIKQLPSWIGYLTSLTNLQLAGSQIKILPSFIGHLTSLTDLDVSGTPIKKLPSSIGHLSGLQKLDLHGCKKLKKVPPCIYRLQHLWWLDLSWCPKLVNFPNKASSEVPSLPLFPRLQYLLFEGCRLISLTEFLECLDCTSTLDYLNLSGSDFGSLPACLSKFVGLHYLKLHGCKSLRNILELPQFLEEIDVGDCISLEKFPAFSKILEFSDTGYLKRLYLSNCHRLLVHNVGFDLDSMMEDASVLNQMVSEIAYALVTSQVDAFEVTLPGSKVPNWFQSQKVDVCALIMCMDTENDTDTVTEYVLCELLIEIPRTLKWEETGLVVCAVFEATEDYYSDHCVLDLDIAINEVNMIDYEMDFDDDQRVLFKKTVTETSAHVWLKHIPLKVDIKEEVDRNSDPRMPYLCQLKFVNTLGEGYIFKSCGVHLANVAYDDDSDHYDYDSIDDEDERDEDDASSKDSDDVSSVSISEFSLNCEIDKAEAASVSTAIVLSGGTGISTKRGVEHCDHEEPGLTKKCKLNRP